MGHAYAFMWKFGCGPGWWEYSPQEDKIFEVWLVSLGFYIPHLINNCEMNHLWATVGRELAQEGMLFPCWGFYSSLMWLAVPVILQKIEYYKKCDTNNKILIVVITALSYALLRDEIESVQGKVYYHLDNSNQMTKIDIVGK